MITPLRATLALWRLGVPARALGPIVRWRARQAAAWTISRALVAMAAPWLLLAAAWIAVRARVGAGRRRGPR